MAEEIQKVEGVAKRSWPVIMSWVGGITALIGLFASLGGGVTWLINHHRNQSERQEKIALAQMQANQREYQSSLQTYAELLKQDPLDGQALDGQLNTAMRWVEDFSVSIRGNQDEADISAPALDQILTVLNSGLTRVKGTQAADVQAHLGWAHFLNEQMAQRENGSVAEDDWRAALITDPNNVYAHAMMGNWLLRTGGDFNEAIQHFKSALATSRARPFVRRLQIGALNYLDKPGARAELMRTANDMRKDNELLDSGSRHRILSTCFDSTITDHKQLIESLSAVPSDDAWKTYLWLDDHASSSDTEEWREMKHKFIEANLLELAGKKQDALTEFRGLKQGLTSQPGSMRDAVDSAIARAIP